MRDFVIVGDSTCDLPKEIREKNKIEYVRMSVVIDGKEHYASLDWDEFSPKEYYDFMRGGAMIKTTQVLRGEFENVFTSWLEKGYDILYISCSSGLSGSVGLARIVADELLEKYSERRIFCVDSLNSSLGQGYLVLKAAELRDEG